MTALGPTDVDAIRAPTPRLTGAAIAGLFLIAVGGFATGFLHQVVGPLTLRPTQPTLRASTVPVPEPWPTAPPSRSQPKPTARVAAAKPAHELQKLELPDPAPPKPAVAESATDASTPPSVDAQASSGPQATTPPETPPT